MDVSHFSLEGKVALVTGGSRGIGKATAIGFAKAGADVAVASRNVPGRGLPDLEEVADEVKGLGRRSLAVSAHVARLEQISSLVERVVVEFGKIDILVNNAGTGLYTPVLETEERAWDAIMNLNLKGLFFLSQAVARVMKEQGGGKIINVASTNGFRPEDNGGAYAISKAGVIMVTKVMAVELAQYNIRVNCIAPGAIETRLYDANFAFLPEEEGRVQKEQAAKRIPMGRAGEPEEIAGAMIYLASDASSYVTGQTFIVDGGVLIT